MVVRPDVNMIASLLLWLAGGLAERSISGLVGKQSADLVAGWASSLTWSWL